MAKLSFLTKQKWLGGGGSFKALGETLSKQAYSDVGLRYVKLAVNRWRLILVSRLTKSATSVLKKQSGQLSNAFSAHVKYRETTGGGYSTDIDVDVIIDESKAPYAMLHEEGGTITAKDGFLVIPTPFIRQRVSAAKKRDHYWASKMMEDMIDQNKIFVIPRFAASTKVAMLRRGGGRTKNSGAIPAFILKKSVTLPRRPWLSKGIEDAIDEFPRVMEGIEKQYFGSKKGKR